MNEKISNTFNLLKLCLDLTTAPYGGKWFVSFGTLLNFVRDRGVISGDIDVSVFYPMPLLETFTGTFKQFGFIPVKYIVDPQTNLPLYVGFDREGIKVDIFVWVQSGDYYYHTYDVEMKKPKNGILDQYIMKGCPCVLMDDEIVKHVWPDTRVETNFPINYGSLLDYWYPGWIVPDKNFGQSASKRIATVKNIKELQRNDLRDQFNKSNNEYEQLKKRICGKT